MSLNGVLNTAVSGLQVAQTGLRTVSDNVANVNTPGYVRKVVDQQSLAAGGVGMGVGVAQIRTTADQYLQAASRQATSDTGAASITADTLDQAQTLFGDPNGASSFFGQIDTVFSSFISLSQSPGSAASAQAAAKAQSLFDQAGDIGAGLDTLQQQSRGRIASDVATVNDLLQQLDSLNSEISRGATAGQDTTGAQDQQSQVLDKLSQLMSVQIGARQGGGVVVRTQDGLNLVGAGQTATLGYDGTTAEGKLTVTAGSAVTRTAAPTSGEIGGLMTLSDATLPGLKSQLAELVGQTANTLNAVHNQYSSVPPPVRMTGRNTGLDPDTALAHFSGQETLAVTDASGQPWVAAVIDFDAKTVSVGGTLVGSFTDAATFTSTLNTALAGKATVDFTGSPATIVSADTSGASTQHLVLTGGAYAAGPPATVTGTAATKGGQGFSAYFGLNDLVSSTGVANFATGLQGSDASGFTTGAVTFRITAADGSTLRDVKVTMPPAGGSTMTGLLSTLNSTTAGVGLYGQFTLDSTGALAFASTSGAGLQVASDSTKRGGSGPSFSALFGVGDAARGAAVDGLSVRTDIQSNPALLATATWKPGETPPLSAADTSGADALAQSANSTVRFAAAGGAGATTSSLSAYASGFSSSVARAASAATDASGAAAAIKTEADARRSSVEGVNIDQELISMTTYQQAYNASARMIQAAKDMYDTLLSMMN